MNKLPQTTHSIGTSHRSSMPTLHDMFCGCISKLMQAPRIRVSFFCRFGRTLLSASLADSERTCGLGIWRRAVLHMACIGRFPCLRHQQSGLLRRHHHLSCLKRRHLSPLSSRHLSHLNSRHLSCLNRRHLSCLNRIRGSCRPSAGCIHVFCWDRIDVLC